MTHFHMTRRALWTAFSAAALGLLPTAELSGQSLLSGYGFGSYLESLDAREIALGGVGVGLRGATISPQDPASSVDQLLPAVGFTSRTTWSDVSQGELAGSHTGSRFPAMGIMYPLSWLGTVSLTFSGILDQNWSATQQRTLFLEGSGTEAKVTDRFVSEGGLSALRVGLSRRLGDNVAVGVDVGSYVGDVTRRFARTFDSLEVETSVPTFQIGGNWSYGGLTAAAGVLVDFPGIARVAGAYSLGGDLDVNASANTDGPGFTMAMPSDLRLGGTAILSDRLFLNLGLHHADWTEAGESLPEVEGESVLRLGGGLEWVGWSLLGKPSAFRLGYRQGDLPFHPVDEPAISESIWSAGVGLNLLESNGLVLAQTDFAYERGSRDAGFLEETFDRLSISVRISGF